MIWAVSGGMSLACTFGLLSLVTIALITAAQVGVQWILLRNELLDWERGATAESIRIQAAAALAPEDFARWETPEAQGRFERFFRRALSTPEVLRIKVYGADMRVVWSDERRLLGVRFEGNASLKRALAGETVAHLERAEKPENLYERGFVSAVELYVPISFPAGPVPGTARVAGVVEIYKDPGRMFSNITRDRLTIVAASLGGALLLYGVLFWIVRRAARELEAQQRDLARQAAVLQATNAELVATQKQLRLSERLAAIGEVSATVAHGIRNPLASIRASAQVALDALDDRPGVERYLRAITDEVDRLGGWLRSLLESVRPFELHPGPVDVNHVVRDLLALLDRRLAAAGIAAEPRLAVDLPRLTADEVQLQQALLGVLENAIEAMPDGGRLAVTTEGCETDGRPAVRVTIRDTGEGIHPDRLSRVFEPLFTTKSRGTGLGLAIARKVVERHGGRIAIDSRPGAGTAVSLALPVGGPQADA